jgi:hypothetical protein
MQKPFTLYITVSIDKLLASLNYDKLIKHHSPCMFMCVINCLIHALVFEGTLSRDSIPESRNNVHVLLFPNDC